MSAGGFIAQALLGGTHAVGKGWGDQLREEAKLKRQQALDTTRTENGMKTQTHGSALRIGEDNLQREHQSGESEKDRDLRRELADKQHDQSKDLMDYRLSHELKLSREKAQQSGKLTDTQNAYLERINGDIDHLQRMERELSTGKTGEFGEIGIVTPDNSAEKLKEIRQRIKSREIIFNRVLGGTQSADPSVKVLEQASSITDPAERQEFLSDLKGSRVYSDELAGAVQEVWSAESQPTQQEQGQARTEAEQPAPQPEPAQRGMLSEASQGQAQQPQQPALQAAPPETQPTPEPEPQQPQQTQQPQDWREQKLGPQIEQGVKAVAGMRDQAIQRRASESVSEMERLAVSNKQLSPQEKFTFLQRHGKHIKDAPPEIQEQMIQIFGRNMLTPYLK